MAADAPRTMKTNARNKPTRSTLRSRVEALLKKQAGRLDGVSSRDVKSLVHELETHQIELEMQNEELRRAREDLEAIGRKYADLYNFAPVGYLTLDKKGIITEANMTTVQLIGERKRLLIGKSLNSFLASPADGNVFFKHRAEALTGIRAVCELSMRKKDKSVFFAQLETIAVKDEHNDNFLRTAMTDITKRRQAEDTFRRYAQRLVEMEEDIRKKLAAELHDELGRNLTLLGINFTLLTEDMPEELQKKQGARIKGVRGLIEDASRIVRNIMGELRPPVLDDYGLPAALRWHCGLYSKSTAIRVNIRAAEPFPRIGPEKESALFRIAQEALVNVAKHARASGVTLTLGRAKGRIRLSIADNGRGFELRGGSAAQAYSGWGLTIMRERALSVGGTFRLDTAPGKGTSIVAEVPEEM